MTMVWVDLKTGVLDRLVEMLAAPPIIRIAEDSGI